MITEELFLRIAGYASQAPSSHNTQPWKFKLEGEQILIIPDLARKLPVVDPDNHALFISLGCAIENLEVAARHYGFTTQVSMNGKEESDPVKVKIANGNGIKEEPLFQYIKQRQVTKGKYDQKLLDEQMIEEIERIPLQSGIQIRIIQKASDVDALKKLVVEGSNNQFSNRLFVEELVSWLRFSRREAMHTGDGIWNATMGLPPTGRVAGEFIMKRLVGARSEAKRWRGLMDHSAGFVMFLTEKNTREHWINLGRSFQRFGLKTTMMGLKHAHMNMPLEEVEIRQKIAEEYHLDAFTPLLLLRIGYASPAPYSFRRNLHEMIE